MDLGIFTVFLGYDPKLNAIFVHLVAHLVQVWPLGSLLGDACVFLACPYLFLKHFIVFWHEKILILCFPCLRISHYCREPWSLLLVNSI